MRPLSSHSITTLKQFQRVGYKSALIAGGAVRDAYFNRPPHDIDIYIWNSTASNETIDLEFQVMNKQALSQLFGSDISVVVRDNYSKRETHISTVNDVYESSQGIMYQVIVLNINPIEYVMQHFDIGLCMCYCDGIKMRYGDAFLHDALNKQLTVRGNLTEQEYLYSINHHLKKLKKYFPDFSVVDKLKGTV